MAHDRTVTEPAPPADVTKANQESAQEIADETPARCPEQLVTKTKNPAPSLAESPVPEEKPHQKILDSAMEFIQVSSDYWERGDLENAIDALDQAYAIILTVDAHDARPEILQQKEDLRFTISKRIAEVYASRFTVVNGDHKAIPMDMNPHVEKAIALFKGKDKNFFRNAYLRSGRYRQAIIREIKKAGLPEELSWLPLIESGFKTKALSRARALGMWQFIASTGYKFGLKRDKWVDERMDITRSTTAAIAYLKELHKIFGDWTTVLAAYNCGEGRVLKVIRTQSINYLDNFWDLYERLPRETAFYVPRFMAVLHIVHDPEKYGITLPPVDSAVVYDTVTIDKQVHLKTVAEHLDVSYKDLKVLNPALRQQCTPDRPYDLNVPREKGEILLAELDNIPEWRPPVSAYVIHRVRRGDSLSVIARRYRTSMRKIMAMNNLRRANYLKVGWRLKIPTRGVSYAAEPAGRTMAGKRPESYVVRKGDSLWKLAKRFGTTTKAIQTLNHLPNSRLKIGQVLKMPEGSASFTMKTKHYRVRKGDSAYLIASKYQMSLSEFLSINCLTPRSTIYPGQLLLVKAQ